MGRVNYPSEISVNMLAELTGKDRATVKRRLEHLEPVKVLKKQVKYDLKTSLKYIFEPMRPEFEDEESDVLNPILEKAKLDRARRVSVELDNKIKTKELIPKEDLKDTLSNIFGAVRSKLLNIPIKAVQSVPENPSKKVLQAHLKKQVNEALKELSEKNFNESL